MGARLVQLGLLGLLLAAALVARAAWSPLVGPDGRLSGREKDTLRRILRVRQVADPAAAYPPVEPREGFPEGSGSHWTLPMDLVILGAAALLPAAWEGAGPFAGAAYRCGPILGLAAVLLFYLLARRLLGEWRALLAAAVYGLSATAVVITQLGNGDHQSLHHLCCLAAVLGGAGVAAGGGRGAAAAAGAAAGLGLWVSTETQAVILLLLAAALADLLRLPAAERGARAGRYALFAAAALAVAYVGDRIEHPGAWWTCEWDRVSGLHLLPLAGGAAGLAAAAGRRRPGPGAILGAALGGAALAGLPLIAVPGLWEELSRQAELFRAAARWTDHTVNEYRPLLFARDFRPAAPVAARFTPLIWILPLLAAGFARARRPAGGARLVLGVAGAGLALLAVREVKLTQLFLLVWPFLVVAGGEAWLGLLAGRLRGVYPEKRVLQGGAAALLAWTLLFTPWRRDGAAERDYDLALRGLTDRVAELRPPRARVLRQTVLAPWYLGADLLYHTDKPVVASGYHRNLAGIHDSYRVLLSPGWREAEPILRRRGVRWIVTAFDLELLLQAPAVVPGLQPFARVEGERVVWLEAAHRTLWNHLHGVEAARSERFRCVYESPVRTGDEGREVPLFRVYEVAWPGEG